MGWDAITNARATLSEATSTHKLLLEGNDALAQEKSRAIALAVSKQLIHAQEAMLSVAQERSEPFKEIENLSPALKLRTKIVKYLDAYYLANESGAGSGDPYCLLCWERSQVLIHLNRKSPTENCCPNCDRDYLAETTGFGI
ncbi:hypothetical protein [Lysobacter gummosus]|uniref:Uncharacterized protein n=1 Tax=Lysobacter gummosus TaxID=262324 RepID=A0ABY3X7A0_9GAMM|nr:hypothetical protein [Lysobacter gummosus]UNP28456.1 hypothetical protein MOV92_18430 [Lysobacter gummosus]